MRVFKFFSLFLILFGFSVSTAFAETGEAFSSVYKKYNQAIALNNYEEALVFAEKAYEMGKEKFKGGSQEMASLAFNLGLVLNQNQEYGRALPFLAEGLEGLKTNFGEDNINLLDSYIELGKANVGLHKTSPAKRYFRKAIELVELEYGAENALLVDINLEIGNFIFRKAQVGAEDFYEHAYLVGKAAFPEGDYRTGIAAFSLGKVYDVKRRKKKAEQFYLEALQIYEKAPPPDLAFVMVAHTFLVQFYSEKGDDEKATEHCVKVGYLRGNADIDSARPLYKMRPTYPQSALEDGKEGTVLIKYSVGADGKVMNTIVQDSSGDAFSKMALRTIQKWRYAPRIVDGNPVQTDELQYRISFRLTEE